MIPVTAKIAIDEREIDEQFVRASGPGGQNVNKLSTAVQLRFDVRHSPSLPPEVRARLERLAGARLTRDGVLVIIAQRHRTQGRNREDALERLLELIRQAAVAPDQAPADQADQGLARAPHRRQETPLRHQAAARRQAGIRLTGRGLTPHWSDRRGICVISSV